MHSVQLLSWCFGDQKSCNGNETLQKKRIGLKGVKIFCENAFVEILPPWTLLQGKGKGGQNIPDYLEQNQQNFQ